MITKHEALTANLFHDEQCRRWRRNGMTQTWKRAPARFRVPVKFGMYDYDQITDITAYQVHLPGSEGCTRPEAY